MHVGSRFFSKDMIEKTIVPVDSNIESSRLGQRAGFSRTDIAAIKQVYVS